MMAHRRVTLLKIVLSACILVCSSTSAVICRQQETAEQFVERVKKAIEKEEWGRAQSGIRYALALKPDLPEAHLLAAQVYWHEGARSMAIDSLEKAIMNRPVFPEAHFLFAECLLDDGKLDRAGEEANVAIAQGTPLFPGYRLLAKIDLARGDFDAAIVSLETVAADASSGNPD